jgi:hypothetical protein
LNPSAPQPADAPEQNLLVRVVRVTAIAAALAYGFHLSREASIARGNEDVPGMLVAIGILSGLFFIRAIISEMTPDANRSVFSKDVLWGLSAGGAATIVLRLLGQ